MGYNNPAFVDDENTTKSQIELNEKGGITRQNHGFNSAYQQEQPHQIQQQQQQQGQLTVISLFICFLLIYLGKKQTNAHRYPTIFQSVFLFLFFHFLILIQIYRIMHQRRHYHHQRLYLLERNVIIGEVV